MFPGEYSWYYAIPNTQMLLTFGFNNTVPGAGTGGMRCFNWSTGAACATPQIPLGNGNNLINAPYGADQLFPDTGSGGCYITYGDTAVWELWTITSNGTITEGCVNNSTVPFVADRAQSQQQRLRTGHSDHCLEPGDLERPADPVRQHA